MNPLPKFDDISINDCPRFSQVLEIGKNPLTKWGNTMMGWPYEESYTHAMIHLENGKFLDMGFNARITDYTKLSKSHTYTVISYTDLTELQIEYGIKFAYEFVEKYKLRFYDFMGYLGFLSRVFPFFNKIKWLKGSDYYKFCSDLNVYMYHKMQYELFLNKDGNKYTPCDLFIVSRVWPDAVFNNLVLA
jgi:hypothetical protein